MENEETQAVEEVEESAPSEETQAVEEVEESAPLENDGVQKRINKITADKHAERRRAEAAEARLKELEEKQANAPTKAPSLDDPEIDYDEDKYLEARIDYGVKKAAQESRLAQKGQTAQAAREAANSNFAQRVEKVGIDDYSEVIQGLVDTVPLSVDIVDAIQADEKGPELAYYLGKNLDVADKVAGMPPIVAALELGKISAKLSSGKPTKLTKAPAPVKQAGAGGGVRKDEKDMTMEEFYNRHG